ncbi:MAG: tetratricopeptide repeat protein [Bacteroidales bacterium]|nr:tetratricopeptide repeat protein [Bacteroidales bacterium]
MQRLGIFVVIMFLLLDMPVLMAQRVTPEQRQEHIYNQALDLYRKEKFAAAQQFFDQTAAQNVSTQTADANFYAAVCAVKLNNDDAAIRLEQFLKDYPYSTHCNMARLYLGNFYYARSKFDKALTYYRLVNGQEIEYNHRSEYNFKTGYCYLMADNLKSAKPYFMQQIDGESKYRNASLYYYAHIQYADGEYGLSLSNFEKLKQSDNRFAKIATNYEVRLYYYLGRHEDVLRMAPDMIKDPETYKPAEISQMVAEIYYSQGNYLEALPYYYAAMAENEPAEIPEKAEKVAPSRAYCTPQDNYYQMGYCYYMLQKYDSAAYFLEKKTACIDSVAQNALYTLGDIYLQQGRKDDARSMFLQASKMNFNPQVQEESLFCYAKLSCELNKNPYNESIRSFQSYLKKYPATKHKEEVQEILASLYLTTSNYKDALTLIEGIKDRSVTLNRAYQRILVNYGVELFNKTKIEQASELFAKAAALNADVKVSADANYLHGEAQYRLGNYKQAYKSIDRFLLSSGASQSPYYLQALYTQGYICMRQKDYDDAAKHFANFTHSGRGTVESHQFFDAYNRMGDCRYVSRRYSESIEFYDKVIKAQDADADYATYQKALAYGALGDDPHKFVCLNQLLSDYPKSSLASKALLEMADTYMKLDDNEKALETYEQFLAKYPTSSRAKDALLNIGLIYYNTKRDAEALDVFDRLLKKYPETDESRYAISTIKSIYIDQDRVEEYFTYIQSVTNITFSELEQDSTIYLAAEDRYMSGEYAAAALALENYLNKYPNGLFNQKAHYYAADSYNRTMHPDKALPHYLSVASAPKGRNTEKSLLAAAGIAYDRQNYELADSLYLQLNEKGESSGNRITGRLGVLRCRVQLGRLDDIEAAADALLSESKITMEHREEALISKARVSYERKETDSTLSRYAILMSSSNGEYSGEAAYRRAETYYNNEFYVLAEKEIDSYVNVAASDYWLAKTFILWADIYYNVHHNNLQAKQTLQSIIDNYDGEELVDLALKKRNAIIDSEAPEQQPEEPEMIIDIND